MSLLNVPVIPIPDIVFFPKTSLPIYIEGPHYTKMIYDALNTHSDIAISMATSFINFESIGQSSSDFLFRPCEICSVGTPIILEKYNKNAIKVLFNGIKKIKLISLLKSYPYPVFESVDYPDVKETEFSDCKVITKISNILFDWVSLHTDNATEKEAFLNNLKNLEYIIDYASMLLIRDKDIRQLILESSSLNERIHMLNLLLTKNNPLKENIQAIKAFKNFEIIDKVSGDGH